MEYSLSKKCAAIALHYGETPQLKMMIEESAELTQSICKMFRSVKGSDGKLPVEVRNHYIEELADVLIMAEQLMILLDARESTYLYNTMRFKLRRQLDRIEKEAIANGE
ncbi:MAG: hypothetical protein IKP95_09520 [Ruminococcus sp.]|nr:hypothetical protein [Ruminococcus sp.]